MSVSLVFGFLGGIGLFLLGMRLMTEGLTVAAGDALRAILSAATRSRLRGLASGVLITAVVQSSSAVIVTTVGFVNAGLLTLSQAIGVIYGSNLGTTLTSWIVALLGFSVNLQALAMPAIGLGMTLSVTLSGRPGALGKALAGLGLFFLGIASLHDTFGGIGDIGALEQWAGQGMLSQLLFVAAGIILTILMQSSSAALTVILTASAGGMIPFTAAAAMVIGANVGTTSTAAFAVIGATATAKRAASAHVIFNLITGLLAFLMLPLLLRFVDMIAQMIGASGQMAVALAIFHTTTKLLGIVLMWPFTDWLVRMLGRSFRTSEENASQPRFLDRNVQTSPSLAVNALALELHRMNALARDMATQAISSEEHRSQSLESAARALENLNLSVSEFASGIPRSGGASALLKTLPDAQRVAQYLVNLAEHALDMVAEHPGSELPLPALAEARNRLRAHAVSLLERARVDSPDWSTAALAEEKRRFEADYQALKVQILQAGTAGELPPRRMATALETLSDLHRIIDQASKAALYLDHFIRQTSVSSPVADPAGQAHIPPVPAADTGAAAGPGAGAEETVRLNAALAAAGNDNPDNHSKPGDNDA